MSYLGKDKIPFGKIESETTTSEWLPYGIGIDVHLNFAIVSIVVPDYSINEVKCYWQKVNVNQMEIADSETWIREVLKGVEPPYNFVIESTSTYHFPFIRYFSTNMRPIIINPTIAGKDKRKTDKYDSRKLAYHCMTGLWKPTPVVAGNQETLRVLTRQRRKLESYKISLTNRMATRLTQYGITFTQEVKPSSMQAIQTIDLISQGVTDVQLLAEIAGDVEHYHFASVKDLPIDIRLFFALNLKGVKEFEEKIDLLTIQIRKIIDLNYQKDFELLKTIPGFGDKSAQI